MRRAAQFLVPAVFAALFLAWATGATRADAAGSFQPVGSMAQARDSAQATLLTDGTVLVTGGVYTASDILTPLRSAELFDPRTNQFMAVDLMLQPHIFGHRAVRLRDGQVLVVGGQDSSSMAEIYDPATRRFGAAGDLGGPLIGFTATVLPDGRVLLAGGRSGISAKDSATDSVELFDPASRLFRTNGKLIRPRFGHAAVALTDGRVVVMGGVGTDGQELDSVEIYDPESGSFSPQGRLVEPRTEMAVSLLSDGRIVVVGGTTSRSIEIYDPATGASTIMGALPDARHNAVWTALANGSILMVGGNHGATEGFQPLATAELIDARSGHVFPTAPMAVEREEATAVSLADGRALVLGGVNGLPPGGPGDWPSWGTLTSVSSAEVFLPASAGGQGPP